MSDSEPRPPGSWAGGLMWRWAAIIAWAVAAADVTAAARSLISGDPWAWGSFSQVAVTALGVAGTGAAVETFAVRRDATGRARLERRNEMARAVRTGVLPPGAGRESWESRVRMYLRSAATLGTILSAVCVAASVLTVTAAELNDDGNPVLMALAVVPLLLPGLFYVMVVRARRMARRLSASL